MRPIGGSGCGVAACEADLNVCCHLPWWSRNKVGCKSACFAGNQTGIAAEGSLQIQRVASLPSYHLGN
ncbi:hypothetical protein DVH24_023075 [Malus domestica]|uniref:Uncharacterized protein n=1 Tax=Malus domestica TaxID=3750 RepID=A0A498KPA0_MALDO|nr:hypothetical protein DVH24_023075 [Malus domestica]